MVRVNGAEINPGRGAPDETMLYAHVAEAPPRDVPDVVCNASSGIADPDRRVLAMLGARGSHVAENTSVANQNAATTAA